jgi:hypothetical protein
MSGDALHHVIRWNVEFFWVEGWAALTRGPECSASGAEERGLSFGSSLQQ